MSNIAAIYSKAVGSEPSEGIKELQKASEQITTEQQELKWNWLNSTITQQVFKSIIDDENKLIDFAIVLACQSTPNHSHLSQILIRVDTLRKLRADFSNKPQPNQ